MTFAWIDDDSTNCNRTIETRRMYWQSSPIDRLIQFTRRGTSPSSETSRQKHLIVGKGSGMTGAPTPSITIRRLIPRISDSFFPCRCSFDVIPIRDAFHARLMRIKRISVTTVSPTPSYWSLRRQREETKNGERRSFAFTFQRLCLCWRNAKR